MPKMGAKRMYLAPVGTHARSYADNPGNMNKLLNHF